ncbi:SymE family type I addiction module toxin [Spirosoma spitsbergense]|uniref:SymE family type I addiction module toxin n=1 Tax=Spirosoma spitsbergense TaxID=431554 RepID=UPI0003815C64|nr:SymE family type I addiction module toxin [Spirosoma spitsbergense]
MMVTNRQKKVQAEARNDYRNRCTRFLPALKLSGHWMASAGFSVGDQVSIEVSDGQLIIRKI